MALGNEEVYEMSFNYSENLIQFDNGVSPSHFKHREVMDKIAGFSFF